LKSYEIIVGLGTVVIVVITVRVEVEMKNVILSIIPGLREKEGRYAVEIEAEGRKLPMDLDDYWSVHNDGSLQAGLEAKEYVMNEPSSLEGVKIALNYLDAQYKKLKTVVEETQTSGVHVHVNVQDYTPKELFTFMVTYFILEELLLKFCGEQREGNHFCLRAKDAEFIIDELVDSARTHKFGNLKNDNIRYCSLNPCSLFKYGSIEFRAMRGTPDLNAIFTWVKIIDRVRLSAKNFENPAEVAKLMSMGGEAQFVRTVLGEYADLFMVPGYKQMVKDGVRLIQPLAFCTDWTMYKDTSANPFRRSL